MVLLGSKCEKCSDMSVSKNQYLDLSENKIPIPYNLDSYIMLILFKFYYDLSSSLLGYVYVSMHRRHRVSVEVRRQLGLAFVWTLSI